MILMKKMNLKKMILITKILKKMIASPIQPRNKRRKMKMTLVNVMTILKLKLQKTFCQL
jgi:hypothetical protein